MEVVNLKAYLANIGMKSKEFAKILDCAPAYIAQIMHGDKTVSRRFAKDVNIATNGVIILKTKPRKKDLQNQEPQDDQNQVSA